jgi:hypothetical protein
MQLLDLALDLGHPALKLDESSVRGGRRGLTDRKGQGAGKGLPKIPLEANAFFTETFGSDWVRPVVASHANRKEREGTERLRHLIDGPSARLPPNPATTDQSEHSMTP